MSKDDPLRLLENSDLKRRGFEFRKMPELERVSAIEIKTKGELIMVISVEPKSKVARYLKIGSNDCDREKAISVLNSRYDVVCLNP